MNKLIRPVIMIVMCALASASPTFAQDHNGGGEGGSFGDDAGCHNIWPCTVGWEDGDELSQGPVGSNSPEPTFYHSDCRSTVGCGGACHYSCAGGGQDEETQQVYLDLLEALEQGDELRVLRLSEGARELVEWNDERGALQIRSCDSSALVGSLIVERRLAAEAGFGPVGEVEDRTGVKVLGKP